jgi:ATP diphosphatase
LVHGPWLWQNPGLHPDSTINADLDRVVAILQRLRAPGGCPWDRKQSFDSIRPHTIEEAYEVLEAVGDRDWPALREELGDLLLQVLFYAEMAAEEGHFTLHDVLETLAEKLVRRHPHVFAETANPALSPDQALARWNAAKAAEKNTAPKSLMDGIPKHLPALAEAAKIGQRAASVGFDWPDLPGVLAKMQEELGELRREIETGADPRRLEDELGDVLFSLTNLARHLDLEPESALKRASRKFRRRFQGMEAQADTELASHSPEKWDQLWRQAKQREGNQS